MFIWYLVEIDNCYQDLNACFPLSDLPASLITSSFCSPHSMVASVTFFQLAERLSMLLSIVFGSCYSLSAWKSLLPDFVLCLFFMSFNCEFIYYLLRHHSIVFSFKRITIIYYYNMNPVF